MDRLSNLAMKPNEITKELLNRLTKKMVIIKESYEPLENKPPCPNQDVQGRYSENAFTGHLKQTEASLQNVHIVKLFWAALPQAN